jgi:hypothetical protein
MGNRANRTDRGGAGDRVSSEWPPRQAPLIMSDLDKLKKENKKLRALLRNAVELLNQSKKLLKQPEKASSEKKKRKK